VLTAIEPYPFAPRFIPEYSNSSSGNYWQDGNALKHMIGKILLSGIALLGAASALIHPFGPIKAARSNASLMPEAALDPQIAQLLEKSCQNCHSEKTEWPWYSYIAPLSWMIESDVHRGRSHMNLSRWNEYSLEERGNLLSQIGVMVRNRAMPLPKYLLLHPEARISDAEIAQLNEWARTERKRMKLLAKQAEGLPSGGGD
jgi:hypothetical protein